MSATGTLPWDLTPAEDGPRRGSVEDYGGATLEDEDPAPDKATMLYADLCNGLQRGVAAHDRAVFAVGIGVHFTGSTPAITQVTGPGEAASIGTSFTVTDNGTGDTTITWPAGTFPPSVLPPMVARNGGVVGGGIDVVAVTNGVRVRTWNGSNAGTDYDFTVTVW